MTKYLLEIFIPGSKDFIFAVLIDTNGRSAVINDRRSLLEQEDNIDEVDWNNGASNSKTTVLGVSTWSTIINLLP